MPAKPSAQKRHRQSLKRRQVNRSWKKKILSTEKDFLALLEKDPSTASEALKRTSRTLSRAAARRVIHPRTASRKISRLSRKLVKAK